MPRFGLAPSDFAQQRRVLRSNTPVMVAIVRKCPTHMQSAFFSVRKGGHIIENVICVVVIYLVVIIVRLFQVLASLGHSALSSPEMLEHDETHKVAI
jgi:hypothetical protein